MNVTVRELRKNLSQHLNSDEDVVILKWGKPIAILKKPQTKLKAVVDGKVTPVNKPKVEIDKPAPKEKIHKVVKPPSFMCEHGMPKNLCKKCMFK